jgi:hypothetical protein
MSMGGPTCHCGTGIKDNTDLLPNKAHLIADQDFQDYQDASRSSKPQWADRFIKATVYQCPSCSRLIVVPRQGSQQTFAPDEPSTGILRSVMGQKWKRVLHGAWSDLEEEGRVFWGNNTGAEDEDNGYASLKSWKEVEELYYRMFRLLSEAGQLRISVLRRNAGTPSWEDVHRWEPPTAEREGFGTDA